jgi:SRSO17 transposase
MSQWCWTAPDRSCEQRSRRWTRVSAKVWVTIAWRESSADRLASRFLRLRVRAAHRDYILAESRPEEWLLIEWLNSEHEPTKYWLSIVPEDFALYRLVDLAKLRWRIERGSC